MDNISLIERLAQAEDSEAAEAFESFMQTAARTAFVAVMLKEVETLCGKAYHPDPEGEHQRAGSAPGRYFFGTEEIKVPRPRVRTRTDGKSAEVRLASYEAAQGRDSLHDAMLRAFMAGMPSREQKRMFKGAAGTSHGEVSRLWQKEGERCIQQLRERDLGKEDYVVLMLDGIGLGDDLCAVVALGITVQGEKHILDFQIGASENLEVCTDLLNRIEERGFTPKRRLLAVTDGSKALRKGIRKKVAQGDHPTLPDPQGPQHQELPLVSPPRRDRSVLRPFAQGGRTEDRRGGFSGVKTLPERKECSSARELGRGRR